LGGKLGQAEAAPGDVVAWARFEAAQRWFFAAQNRARRETLTLQNDQIACDKAQRRLSRAREAVRAARSRQQRAEQDILMTSTAFRKAQKRLRAAVREVKATLEQPGQGRLTGRFVPGFGAQVPRQVGVVSPVRRVMRLIIARWIMASERAGRAS